MIIGVFYFNTVTLLKLSSISVCENSSIILFPIPPISIKLPITDHIYFNNIALNMYIY